MNWTNSPAAENSPGHDSRPGREGYVPTGLPAQAGRAAAGHSSPVKSAEIRIGKCLAFSALAGSAKDLEVFTLTLGSETIELLPLKSWHQLDHHKWTVQGKLPAEPAGLEVALDHVKITGGTVALNDPAGCAKLEQLFNEWLLFERETLELARKKARPQTLAAALQSAAQPAAPPLRFRVEVDKRAQVHIHCLQGKETLASVGLSVAGINSLHQQGLMRKPHKLATGALHDWVELDGELCSFEKGGNDAARLEQILNERYLPEATVGHGQGSPRLPEPGFATGFDVQFPVTVGGMPDNHRHHLNEQSLESLQDPDHCGLLHKEIIVKLIPPNLVFKQKTPDGGEQYLPWGPETTVTVTDEEGHEKTLHLSQPLNLLRLSAAELMAVFNHPAINRHTKAAPPAQAGTLRPHAIAPAPMTQAPTAARARQRRSRTSKRPCRRPEESRSRHRLSPSPRRPLPPARRSPRVAEPPYQPIGSLKSLPNIWLKEILAQPALAPDWFAVLTYSKMAERFGNSNEGKFGPCDCWYISLGESEDIADPAFKGVFITEKGSLGFVNAGQMARFYNGVAFIGPQDAALEGIQVKLIAVGLDSQERLVFVLSDNYRAQFGVREATLGEVLNGLRDHGAVIMSAKETLANAEPDRGPLDGAGRAARSQQSSKLGRARERQPDTRTAGRVQG